MAGPFQGLSTGVRITVLLTELLAADRVRVPLAAQTKEAALEELVGILHARGAVSDPAAVLRAVRQREEQLSTGIGGGVAIPHGKAEGVPGLTMAAGVSAAPVDFAALDGQPVRLFFLLVGPESASGAHVKALSRVARLVRAEELRRRLVEAPSPEAFMSIVTEAESA
ncbi:MAG TPA: PTS sugar transporter subunit IIA [Longimicrobium sp.]|nr:PTS sugar transporter subunit IIA [Longimicrobium sp.]